MLNRLNRIEGQVCGIKGMIEKDIYCDDMLNQISSVQASLNDVGKLVLEYHMQSCVIERIQVGDTEVLTEFMKTINKLMK
ncbi:MAG TPA: CsoR family transcriptional regulator [Paenibacillus sp.]|nr:CsoR family transcriptional regulator [Paenibacillus sp.]